MLSKIGKILSNDQKKVFFRVQPKKKILSRSGVISIFVKCSKNGKIEISPEILSFMAEIRLDRKRIKSYTIKKKKKN
jgi:hypothetical protein